MPETELHMLPWPPQQVPCPCHGNLYCLLCVSQGQCTYSTQLPPHQIVRRWCNASCRGERKPTLKPYV